MLFARRTSGGNGRSSQCGSTKLVHSQRASRGRTSGEPWHLTNLETFAISGEEGEHSLIGLVDLKHGVGEEQQELPHLKVGRPLMRLRELWLHRGIGFGGDGMQWGHHERVQTLRFYLASPPNVRNAHQENQTILPQILTSCSIYSRYKGYPFGLAQLHGC